MKPASSFKSVSLPSDTARSARTHGRRIRPSPISCSPQWSAKEYRGTFRHGGARARAECRRRCGGSKNARRHSHRAKDYFGVRRIRSERRAPLQVHSQSLGIPFPGHHGSTGDGIKMGLGIGAAVENMGAFQPYPAYVGPGKRAVAPEVALSGGIMVDAAGKRFVDETRYPGGLGIKMLDLPGKQAYEIFDERIFLLHRNAAGARG